MLVEETYKADADAESDVDANADADTDADTDADCLVESLTRKLLGMMVLDEGHLIGSNQCCVCRRPC